MILDAGLTETSGFTRDLYWPFYWYESEDSISSKRLIVSAIVTPARLSHCNVFDHNVILHLLVFSAGQFCVVRNSSLRNLWKNILQIWQQSRDSCKVRISFSFFPFHKTVTRYKRIEKIAQFRP